METKSFYVLAQSEVTSTWPHVHFISNTTGRISVKLGLKLTLILNSISHIQPLLPSSLSL